MNSEYDSGHQLYILAQIAERSKNWHEAQRKYIDSITLISTACENGTCPPNKSIVDLLTKLTENLERVTNKINKKKCKKQENDKNIVNEKNVIYELDIPNIREELEKVIIGQNAAIELLEDYLVPFAHGWYSDSSSQLVLLFLGSTGVGKTQTAIRISEILYPNKKLKRFDMSEYSEPNSISKLIGTSPGYVGFHSGGALIRELETISNDGAVILLDEIDKAHPDVLVVLLQLFDEGRITDNLGKTRTFTNLLFILTTNLGEELLFPDREPIIPIALREKLLAHFKRSEFLSRITDIIPFFPLSLTDVDNILHRELTRIREKLLVKSGICLRWNVENLPKLREIMGDLTGGVRGISSSLYKLIVCRIYKEIDLQLCSGCTIDLLITDRIDIEILQQ